MFDGRWRDTVDRGTGPIGRGLQQVGISADVLTATGLISAGATAVSVATGHFLTGRSPRPPARRRCAARSSTR